jgi:hypothetical protein
MSDQHDERKVVSGQSGDGRDSARRNSWERPTLRRLAANKAAGGGNPGDDGQSHGTGATHHS